MESKKTDSNQGVTAWSSAQVARLFHRQDVASWVINQFLKSYSDAEVQLIRQSHYSDTMMLEATYRRMKESGVVPDFLRDALRKQFGVIPDLKRNKKPLASSYINAIVIADKGAA